MRLTCIFCFLFSLTILYGKDPFALLLPCVPPSAGSYFCIRADRLSDLPGMELPVSAKTARKMAGIGEIKHLIFFFSESGTGVLLEASRTPDQILALFNDENKAVKGTCGGHAAVLFGPENDRSAFIFLKDGVILLAGEAAAGTFLKTGMPAHQFTEELPEDVILAGVVCLPPPAFQRQVGWADVGWIEFKVSRKAEKDSPVTAVMDLFPRTPQLWQNVYRTAQEQVRQAYEAGRKKGPVRPEMLNAFTVSPGPASVRIHVCLTQQDAAEFFSLIRRSLEVQ